MPEDRLPVARILLAALALTCGIAAAIGVVFAVLGARGLPPGGPAVARPVPPGASRAEPSTLAQATPMLQAAPQPDLARYRAEKAHALDELAWADAAHATARVPIREAMALMEARAASAGPPSAVASSQAAVATGATR